MIIIVSCRVIKKVSESVCIGNLALKNWSLVSITYTVLTLGHFLSTWKLTDVVMIGKMDKDHDSPNRHLDNRWECNTHPSKMGTIEIKPSPEKQSGFRAASVRTINFFKSQRLYETGLVGEWFCCCAIFRYNQIVRQCLERTDGVQVTQLPIESSTFLHPTSAIESTR